MSNYTFVRIAEKYQDIEPWKVELLYNLSGQDEAVAEKACHIITIDMNNRLNERIGLDSFADLESQRALIIYAKSLVRGGTSLEIMNNVYGRSR